MSDAVRHRQIAFVPVQTTTGRPWFAIKCACEYRRDSVDAFVSATAVSWKRLKQEGWRIVRVEVQS
jgi:hypothetical protein